MAEEIKEATQSKPDIQMRNFKDEADLHTIISMIEKELSEPYPIYTYRYFVQKWPEQTFMAMQEGKCIGCIVSKLEDHTKPFQRTTKKRGYIAMLAVDPAFRRHGLGRRLVQESID
jgi:peptide alpha-N-acetyltransferase